MKILLMLLALSTFVLGGCATPRKKLTPEGKAVQVLEGKPYAGCEVLGKVVGLNDFGSLQVATNHARNLTGEMGGNYILIQDEIKNGNDVKVHAMAYSCP